MSEQVSEQDKQNPQNIDHHYQNSGKSMTIMSNSAKNSRIIDDDNINIHNYITQCTSPNQMDTNRSHTVVSSMNNDVSLAKQSDLTNQTPINGGKENIPNLKKPLSEWGEEHYAFFTKQFNASDSLRAVKELVGQQRTDKLN